VITKTTVFVLGAGASQPYGFPTGASLANEVCAKLSERDPGTEFKMALRREFEIQESPPFDTFVPAFRESGCATLDEFVQSKKNRQFLPLVKAATIEVLIKYEQERKLHPDAPENRNHKTFSDPPRDWYAYLFGMMRADHEDAFPSNQVRVINFNFDRSFEYRLFLMLRGFYGESEAFQLCASVPVLYVHGSLGGPYWLNERRTESRTYEPTATVAQKHELLRHVHIIHEEIDPSLLDQAHRWLSAAHMICFLGFGYHPLNLERLRMREPHDATICGTTFGLSGPEIVRIKNGLGNRENLQLDPTGQNDVLKFLRYSTALQTDRG